MKDSYLHDLMEADSNEVIWRGQGGVKALALFEDHVKDIIKMAEAEKNGHLPKEPNEEGRLY